MKYKTTKKYRFYGDEHYNDVYTINGTWNKSISLKDVPLYYGEIDWSELIDLVTEEEYNYASSSIDHCEIDKDGNTLH